jgi:energy-coupling factor transporter ATP-binding protein EcfA2
VTLRGAGDVETDLQEGEMVMLGGASGAGDAETSRKGKELVMPRGARRIKRKSKKKRQRNELVTRRVARGIKRKSKKKGKARLDVVNEFIHLLFMLVLFH